VPTLYLWGDQDATVGRAAAERTAEHVRAPYRFEVVPGAGHFLTDQASERVTAALLEHFAL
jgi:pimeloyl-ACP methyl ester carboxylesterase